MNELINFNNIFLVTIAVISIIAFQDYGIIQKLKHFPYEENRSKSFYRWITCAFVHGDGMHLFVNLFVLYSFGRVVEMIYTQLLNVWAYPIIFIVILVISNIPSYLNNKNNPSYASIGASGVISGILFISILYFPSENLYLMGVIPIPAIVFGVLYLFYSWYSSKNQVDNVDHAAHYYGALAGLLIGTILDQSWMNSWAHLIGTISN